MTSEPGDPLDQAIAEVAAGRSDEIDLRTTPYRLYDLKSRVAELGGLRRLTIGDNGYPIALPPWLRELPALEHLDASATPLAALPDLPNVRMSLQAETVHQCARRRNLEMIEGVSVHADTPTDAVHHLAELCRTGRLVLTELTSAVGLSPGDTRESIAARWRALVQLDVAIDDVLRSQPSLRRVSMWGCPLGRVPAPLRDLPNLTHLNLGGVWPVLLPSWVLSLPGVEDLKLGWNGLVDLPAPDAPAPALRRLDLSNNPLTRIPEWVWSLDRPRDAGCA